MSDRYILTLFQPFDFKQKIYVFEDGNQIDCIESTMDNIVNDIFNFIGKYEIKRVELVGPIQLSKGIAKKIKNEEMAKYSKNEIVIDYFT